MGDSEMKSDFGVLLGGASVDMSGFGVLVATGWWSFEKSKGCNGGLLCAKLGLDSVRVWTTRDLALGVSCEVEIMSVGEG